MKLQVDVSGEANFVQTLFVSEGAHFKALREAMPLLCRSCAPTAVAVNATLLRSQHGLAIRVVTINDQLFGITPISDADAHFMRLSDHSFALAYNVQLVADAQKKLSLNEEMSKQPSDSIKRTRRLPSTVQAPLADVLLLAALASPAKCSAIFCLREKLAMSRQGFHALRPAWNSKAMA